MRPCAGVVYSYTVVRRAPAHFAGRTPYAVLRVRCDDGSLVAATLTDSPPDAVAIGMAVSLTWQNEICGAGPVTGDLAEVRAAGGG